MPPVIAAQNASMNCGPVMSFGLHDLAVTLVAVCIVFVVLCVIDYFNGGI